MIKDINIDILTLDCTLKHVIFRNEDNSWSVLRFQDNNTKDDFIAKGYFTILHDNQKFTLKGYWVKHPQYGQQFQVVSYIQQLPSSSESLIKFLSSKAFKGIGPKTALKIIKYFGDQVLDVLENKIDRLYEVPKISKKTVTKIISAWKENQSTHKLMMFLANYGISAVFASKIIRTYQDKALDIINSDPYRLALDISGIGFKTADKIAHNLGIPKDSPIRIRAAIWNYFKLWEEQGHCFLKYSQIIEGMKKLLGVEDIQAYEENILNSLEWLENNGIIIKDEIISNKVHINEYIYYLSNTFICETSIAQILNTLLNTKFNFSKTQIYLWINEYLKLTNLEFSKDQIDSCVQAIQNKVFILTGGPGVGKTTTANVIIQILNNMGKTVALCAPTGRAAQRLKEISSVSAKTIHRLLEWSPQEGGFYYNQNNRLSVDTVIVDEASMLDIHLAYSLLSALKDTAQIIFIGDADQLPSVGPGNVFGDLIYSQQIPYVKLTQIFRQAQYSNIVKTAHAINTGTPIVFDNSERSDCKFIEVESIDDIKKIIKILVSQKIPKKYNLDPIKDIQVLTPMNKGSLGSQVLNQELQSVLNPNVNNLNAHENHKDSHKFFVNDKVIQIANNYELGVFNGDIGIVKAVDADGAKVIVEFNDKIVHYNDYDALDLKLAYAITIHKSQGSEFTVVIVPLSMQHYVMLQKNLIYTALTRAKKLAILIGSKKAFNYAISQQKSHERQSLLKYRL